MIINGMSVNVTILIKELVNKTMCPYWCALYAGKGNATLEIIQRYGNMTRWPQTNLLSPKERIFFSLVKKIIHLNDTGIQETSQ